MDLKLYSDVAEWLGKSDDVVRIAKLEELICDGTYYVTMWGHYSAGKSRLINSILDRDILPVQTRETTAVLTYIMYGTDERCHVIYKNGAWSVESLDYVKDVFQNTEKIDNVEGIDHIEVYVNNSILKNGLALVDTPGVNTLIQRHQDIAVAAIEQSGKIVYVLGNSPTNADRNFIREISQCGIDVVFVRTKCDRILEEEESVELALRAEREELEGYVGHESIFIPVSNEKGNQWNSNIEKVRETLEEIALHVADEMKASAKGRLKVYADAYIEELEAVCSQIAEAMKGESDKMNGEIGLCNDEIKKLESMSKESEAQIEEKITRTKALARRDLERLVYDKTDEFVRLLTRIPYSDSAAEEVRRQYELTLTAAIEEMQGIMNGYFDAIIAEEHNIIEGVDAHIKSTTPPSYEEVREGNSRLLEMYRCRLLETKHELERIARESQAAGIEAAGMKDEYDENFYNESLMELDEMLKQIPSETAMRVVEDEKIQPSSVLKTIGQAADMALLFIPGTAIVKGIKVAADTTKIAQVLHKMGKVGEVILKGGAAVAKNANAIDKVRDRVYAVNEIFGKRRYSTKKEKEQAQILVDRIAQTAGNAYEVIKEKKQEGSVFDALSVAYWTEKLGAQFDMPPRIEIDIEAEKNREMTRREITLKQEQLSQERIQKKRALGLITSKEKELEVQEQEKARILEKIEAEIKKQEAEVIEKSREESLEKYKLSYKAFLVKNLSSASKMIADEYYSSANQNVALYVSKQNRNLINRMEERKKRAEELIVLKENANGQLEEKLTQGQGYLTALRELSD